MCNYFIYALNFDIIEFLYIVTTNIELCTGTRKSKTQEIITKIIDNTFIFIKPPDFIKAIS
jgi:hypothetical protein